MNDFYVNEDAKPSGSCIWEDCGKKATFVLDCRKRPISMEVCADHAKKFLDAEVVAGKDGKVGVSIHGRAIISADNILIPEEVAASNHLDFTYPNPPRSFCCIEENNGKGTEGDLDKFPTKDEAFSELLVTDKMLDPKDYPKSKGISLCSAHQVIDSDCKLCNLPLKLVP